MKITLLTLATLAVALLTRKADAAGKKVVCYYTNWSTYRNGLGKFTPEDIDPTLCTHILYSFLIMAGNKITIHDQWIDIDNGYFNKVVDAKKKNPNVKVLAAIGGWNNGSPPFSNMAKTAANRRVFIVSVLDVLTKYKFDGLDLDWEFPGLRGGDARVDKTNFNILIDELQTAFKRYGRENGIPKPLLSAAVNPAPKNADVAYDRAAVCRGLDFVNLMQYDIHGAWDMRTGFMAPLRETPGEETPENVIATTTQEWINAGCERSKLILGIPLYGRGWRTTTTDVIPAGATGPCAQGKYSGQAGLLGYYEICERLSNGWRENYDSTAEQAIATGEGQLVTYDNERSVMAKVDFLNQLGLGGAMVWALDFDDFTGNFCNRGKYPLLTAINRQLGVTPRPTQPSRTTRRPRSTQGPRTTARPRCTGRRCPGRTTTTVRTRPTRSSRTRATTTSSGNSCAPVCTPSLNGKYLPDKCDNRKFHICTSQRRYTMACVNTTRFEASCSCCVNRRG